MTDKTKEIINDAYNIAIADATLALLRLAEDGKPEDVPVLRSAVEEIEKLKKGGD